MDSPITSSSAAGEYWGIDATIQYGGSNGSDSVSLADNVAGFVDTGTTLIYLPTGKLLCGAGLLVPDMCTQTHNALLTLDAYNKYVKSTGGVLDSNTQLPRITNDQYKSLQPLNFVIGGQTFGLTPNAQIWPRTLNTAIQGEEDSIYLAVQDIGDKFPGVNFICGMSFLERFYSVFDTGNHRVGLARTAFTNATTN